LQSKYLDIEKKVERGERLTFEDGVALFASHDIAWLGALADHVCAEKCGDIVYYNVNCHVNLTNICMAHCKFCAFGRDAEDAGAYEMSASEAVAHVAEAMRDPHLAGLHVVSGLHPTWTFDDYLLRLRALHEAFPSLYLKGFTTPIPVMTPFNILSEIATPISMACRHFGNVLSGVVINGLIYAALGVASAALFGLIPGAVGDFLSRIPILAVGLPAIMSFYFDWFSGIMQAFIFTMLTIMYIANAAEG